MTKQANISSVVDYYEYDDRIFVPQWGYYSEDIVDIMNMTSRLSGCLHLSEAERWQAASLQSNPEARGGEQEKSLGEDGWFQNQRTKEKQLNFHSEDGYFHQQKEKQLLAKQQVCCSIKLSICESYFLAYQFLSALKREEKELKNLLLIF